MSGMAITDLNDHFSTPVFVTNTAPIPVSASFDGDVSIDGPLEVTGLSGGTVVVSGTVGLSGTSPVSGTVAVSSVAGTVTVGGTVAVSPAAGVADAAQGTVGTSSAQLSSQARTFGVWITNTHASQTLAVGSSSVSTTRFIARLNPSERLFLPVANDNLLFVLGSAASTTYSLGGM